MALKSVTNRWRLRTGSREAVYQLARDTLVSQFFQRKDSAGRNFAHSKHFYVFDRQGYLRAVLNGNLSKREEAR